LQLDRVEQRSYLFGARRRPAFVLRELDTLIAHLRDGGQRPVEILLPVRQDRIDQQSDGDVFSVLRLQRRYKSGRGEEFTAGGGGRCHPIPFRTLSRKAVTTSGPPDPSASIGRTPRNPSLSMMALISPRSIGVASPPIQTCSLICHVQA